MASRQVKIYSSITEIPAERWDSILDPVHVFHTHRFIHTVELSGVENSRCRPVCFYEDQELVATAVLSAFRVDLGIFLGEKIKKRIQAVQQTFPRFLKPNILFCGLPVSLGQTNLIISREESIDWVLKALDEKMQQVARQEGIRYLALKEFDQKNTQQFQDLQKLGYFTGHSIPYMDMDIRWSSFDDYLSELKHTYRRQIRRSLKKIEPIHLKRMDRLDEPLRAEVRLNQWEHCTPSMFYDYYLKVMERAETKLETLNLAFFEHCFEKLREEMTLITVEKETEILSAGLLFHHSPFLTFALVGNRYEKYPEADPYFNLIYVMIQMAIEEGVTQLKLGQTAYWVKQRVGGEPSERYLYFKAKNKILHIILKFLRKSLFPETQISKIHVFKTPSK